MLLAGYVKDCNSKELVIGLPNGLNGYIKSSSVNEILQKLSGNVESEDDEDEEENESGVYIL